MSWHGRQGLEFEAEHCRDEQRQGGGLHPHVRSRGGVTPRRDVGWELQIRLWVDSSAAKAVTGRLRLGLTRHIEVRCSRILFARGASEDAR